jgi:hypothetical protein
MLYLRYLDELLFKNMKILNLFAPLIFLSNYAYCYSNQIENNKCNYSNLFLNVELNDSLQKSKIFVMTFKSDVDIELGTEIDRYVEVRSGIESCFTDIINKTITITMVKGSLSSNMDFVFNSVRKKYLGAIDAPLEIVLEHKD